jgi:hypothetical protein
VEWAFPLAGKGRFLFFLGFSNFSKRPRLG